MEYEEIKNKKLGLIKFFQKCQRRNNTVLISAKKAILATSAS